MKKFYYKLKNAIVIGIYCYKKPDAIRIEILKLTTGLFELIMKVAIEGKPYMTKIGHIHPEEVNHEVVTIWAGAGLGANPTKRISELLAENAELKRQLSEQVLINQHK
jgi:hypothetical protein